MSNHYIVGDRVTRTTRGLTTEQAQVIITEVGLMAPDNNGRVRPAVRGYQPAFGPHVATWLHSEIRKGW